jgi:hypothetical protein
VAEWASRIVPNASEPMITELFPILSTADIKRSLAFYREILGGR